MNILIYILFLAAKVINLLANVTASQKSCFLGLVLGLTWEKNELGLETGTSAVQCSPQPTYVKRVCPGCVFSIFWTVIWRTPFTKRNKIRIHSVSNADKYEFGLSWTLWIMGRLGVFSLQSATSCAEGEVEGSQAIKQCWRGRGKPWSLVERATTEHWGKVSLSHFFQQDILPWRKPVLSCHLSPTVYCTPALQATTLKSPAWPHALVLPWTEQSRFRPLCSGQNEATTPNQTQPQAERSLQEQPPAHPSHTLSKALAHSCAVAHLHSWSKPGFDTSSSHWKCQMRSRWLGWKQEQQPKLSGEQLIFGTHENKQKYLLIPSNKPDSTSTYSSSSSYFTKGCFSAANCSLWEMPRFNLQPEGCLTIMQGSLCWSTLW